MIKPKIRVISTLCAFATTAMFFADAFALMWNDPNVVPVQSISDHRWRDAKTGRLINVQGMPNVNPAPPTNTPVQPSQPPASQPQPTTQQQPKPTQQNKPTTKANAKGTLKKAGAVVGAAAGAYGIYENTKGQGEHSAENIAGGALSGVLGGASVGALWGVKAGWIGAAIGAVAGGAIAGSQLFSETDCLTDPITGEFSCCNTLFNQGERQVEIGGYMFCDALDTNGNPWAGVRQCLQGGQPTELSWWDGLWQDDTWSPECTAHWCTGYDAPTVGTYVKYIPDTENFCYKWEPAQSSDNDATIVTEPNDPYSALILLLETEINTIKKQCGNIL